MARMKRLFPEGTVAGTPLSLLVRADRDERS